MSRAVYVLIDGELVTKSRDGVTTDEYLQLGKPKQSAFAGYGGDGLPGGVNGIVNHADGKRYDSKSQYERAVKAGGCRIVGNDWNNQDMSKKQIQGDFNVRPELARSTREVLERTNAR